MTAIEQFIKDAIAGGWKPYNDIININDLDACYRYEILLDPDVWQAVGKTRGWIDKDGVSVAKYWRNTSPKSKYDLWLWNWHRFIDHLVDGKTINEALGEISK